MARHWCEQLHYSFVHALVKYKKKIEKLKKKKNRENKKPKMDEVKKKCPLCDKEYQA